MNPYPWSRSDKAATAGRHTRRRCPGFSHWNECQKLEPRLVLSAPTLSLASPAASASIDVDDLNAQGYLDVTIADTGAVTLSPQRFDFGTSSSPLASGFIRQTHASVYSAATGYGLASAIPAAADRGIGTSLQRDFIGGTDAFQYLVDVPSGTYDVTVTMGDPSFPKINMQVSLEGSVAAVASPAPGTFFSQTFSTAVTDGQLTFDFLAINGAQFVVLSGIEIVQATGPAEGLDTSTITDSGAELILQGTAAAGVTVNGVPTNVSGDTWRYAFTGSFVAGDVSASFPADSVRDNSANGNALTTQNFSVTSTADNSPPTLALSDPTNNASIDLDVLNNRGYIDVAIQDTGAAAIDPLRFDFGTNNSALASGFTRVTNTSTYNASTGYGLQSAIPAAADRGTGSDLERDIIGGSDVIVFLADIPNGTYEVTTTLGDPSFYKDRMQLSLEGAVQEVIDPPVGGFASKTYTVNVSDGQLTVELQAIESRQFVVLSGLEIVQQAGAGAGLNDSTITDSSAELTLSGGAASGISVNGTPTLVNDVYRYAFAGSFAAGDVMVTFPAGAVADARGNTNIESAESFTITTTADTQPPTASLSDPTNGGSIDVDALNSRGYIDVTYADTGGSTFDTLQFDFGTSSSPLETGFTRLTASSVYSASTGYGFQTAVPAAADRGSGSNVQRDIVGGTSSLTFLTDVPSGSYEVTVITGDPLFYKDQMQVSLEGEVQAVIDPPTGGFASEKYSIDVTDGQLTLNLTAINGRNFVVLSGLIVEQSGGGGGLDTASVTDAGAEFTLSGTPAAGVTVNGTPTLVSGTTYRYSFIGSFSDGDVTATFNTGTFQDSKGNTNSEATESFSISTTADTDAPTVTLSDPANGGSIDVDVLNNRNYFDVTFSDTAGASTFTPLQFDFGTSSSPLEAGYTRVTNTSTYSAATGYGLQSGVPAAADRGTGTDLQRDMIGGTSTFTFLVDLPTGTYDVTATLGDPSFYKDQMQATLEGAAQTAIDPPLGGFATETWSVSVTDGQLDFDLAAINGRSFVVLSGLRIAQTAGAGSGLDTASVTDSAAEITLSGSAASGVVVSGIPTLVSGTTYRYSFTGSFGDGDVTVNYAAGSFQDRRGNISAAATQAFTITTTADRTPPTATLADPVNSTSIDADTLNSSGYIDVTFSDTGSGTFDPVQVDFGTSGSALQSGFVRLTNSSTYSASTGYGLQSAVPAAADRGIGTSLQRDMIGGTNTITFLADVPAGTYNVTLTMGDPAFHKDQMQISLEGTVRGVASPSPGTFFSQTFSVDVSDGQLTVDVAATGTAQFVVVSGIEIVQTTGASGGLDTGTVTDSGAEFSLSGTATSGVSVNGAGVLVSGTTYRYSFTGTFAAGDVTVDFTAGSFADLAGNTNAASVETFTLTQTVGVIFAANYLDSANEGFFDATLGAARRTAFEFALGIWSDLIGRSYVGETVTIDAQFNPLGSGVLGSAGAQRIHRDFGGNAASSTWYGSALANHLAGRDLSTTREVAATFSSNFNWYYGTDGNNGGLVDFVTVVLHEVGHGINFLDLLNSNGSYFSSGLPGVWDRFLEISDGTDLTAMSQSQRASALIGGNLFWSGTAGTTGNNGTRPEIYAPNPFRNGSSTSHVDEGTHGGELMSPFYSGVDHNPSAMELGMLSDMGWGSISGGVLVSQTLTVTTGAAVSVGVTAQVENSRYLDDPVTDAVSNIVDTITIHQRLIIEAARGEPQSDPERIIDVDNSDISTGDARSTRDAPPRKQTEISAVDEAFLSLAAADNAILEALFGPTSA